MNLPEPSHAVTLPWVTQHDLDLAIASIIGVVVLGCAFCFIEWAARRWAGRREILPPPDRSARRIHHEEWEDTE